MRLTFEQQNILKEKYGVDRLWSYSRLSTFTERPWEYKIVYLDKSARSENVYGIMGNKTVTTNLNKSMQMCIEV